MLASSSSRLPVSFISAPSSFSFIEHLLVANGHARMIQESDVCYTTSMYVTQSWCIPDEIDLRYFRICIITHNNNLFNKTSMYPRSKFCPQKTPIRMSERKISESLLFCRKYRPSLLSIYATFTYSWSCYSNCACLIDCKSWLIWMLFFCSCRNDF